MRICNICKDIIRILYDKSVLIQALMRKIEAIVIILSQPLVIKLLNE